MIKNNEVTKALLIAAFTSCQFHHNDMINNEKRTMNNGVTGYSYREQDEASRWVYPTGYVSRRV
jgi:hypothetical protein